MEARILFFFVIFVFFGPKPNLLVLVSLALWDPKAG